jgi:hypothetical protein
MRIPVGHHIQALGENPGQFLFPHKAGGAIRREGVRSRDPYGDRMANAAGVKVRPWVPNQFRHTYAIAARKAFVLEHAGAALGHAKMSTTEVYAERDWGLAVEVAARIGQEGRKFQIFTNYIFPRKQVIFVVFTCTFCKKKGRLP